MTTNWGIVGGGFGLYGYLPAIAQKFNGDIFVLKKNFKKISDRPELKKYTTHIVYVDTYDELIKKSTSLVLAVPPEIQEEYIYKVFSKNYRYENLILEKPIASNSRLAADILELSINTADSVRVGYSFNDATWAKKLHTLINKRDGNFLDISWKFKAYHYKNSIDSWKTRHEKGGGILRFYGVQIIAILVSLNKRFEYIDSNVWSTEKHGSFKWIANFHQMDGVTISIEVDSKSEDEKFQISSPAKVLTFKSPFDGDKAEGGDDLRVSILKKIITTDLSENEKYYKYYYNVNKLLCDVEASTKWHF
jgi:predicted dehydrogenase